MFKVLEIMWGMFYIPPKCFYHLALMLFMTDPRVLWLLRMGWWRIVQGGESWQCCNIMITLFQCNPWCESSADEVRVLWRKLVWTILGEKKQLNIALSQGSSTQVWFFSFYHCIDPWGFTAKQFFRLTLMKTKGHCEKNLL